MNDQDRVIELGNAIWKACENHTWAEIMHSLVVLIASICGSQDFPELALDEVMENLKSALKDVQEIKKRNDFAPIPGG